MTERVDDWISGGMSWIASLIATLLNPQLRHKPIVTAIANASSGRDDGGCVTEFRFNSDASSVAAMRANTGDFDQRTLWRKTRRARRRLERLRGGAAGRLADSAAALADQKDDEVVAAVIVHAGNERVAAFDAMNKTIVAQEVERAIDRDRGRTIFVRQSAR